MFCRNTLLFFLVSSRIQLLVLFLLLVTNSAFAQRLEYATISEQPQMTADGVTFKMLGKANYSYLCSISIYSGSGGSLSTSILPPSGAGIIGSRPTTAEDARRYLDRLSGVPENDSNLRDNLVFFIAPGGSENFGEYQLTIGTDENSGNMPSVTCVSTTTVCAFNTVVNEFNFLEVTSFGKVDGVAQLRTLNFDGTLNNTTSPAIFPANGRRDFDIHSLAGPGAFGALFVQAINFVPNIDSFGSPKVSTYKNGELTSSLSCEPELENPIND
jgi:hypothetical protein